MDWTSDERRDRPASTVSYRTTFNHPRSPRPSIAIAMALADIEDRPPARTKFTLADAIAPGALDDLVTNDTHDVRVEFTVDDYLVVARSNGTVQIREVEE